ncbi:MAG: serine hydrolase [Cyanobacteria bacterium P01_F01_bin.53]
MTASLIADSAAALSLETLAEMDTYLDAYAETGRFSGNVMVSLGCETMFRSYGLANRGHGIANAPHTKFRIGSITKQFTAAAILQLQDQGLLSVQAPVATYLPDYPRGHDITLHHLLTHSAGIPEYLNGEIFPDIADWLRLSSSLTQVIDRFKTLPLDFEPGQHFKYSNSGYVLLTHILETVSGQPYTDYVQTHIFSPLGMVNSGYEVPQAVIPNLAQGYLFIGAETYLQAEPIDMSRPQGAGGLYSTLEDLATWNTWLHSRQSVLTILSEGAVKQLLNPAIAMDLDRDGPDARYGYGLVHDQAFDRQVILHSGGIHGFRSTLAHYPKETLSICVLNNFENTPSEKVAKDLAAIVFGGAYELPTEPKRVDVDPTLYEKYIGTYQLLPEMQVEIRVEEGQLVGQATGQDSFVLSPSSEADFFATVVDIRITFELDQAGDTQGFTLKQMGQSLFAQKLPE